MAIDWAMPELLVLYPEAGPRVVARSAAVSPEWEEVALQLAARYGRPAAPALFVVDFARSHVAVVTTATEPTPALRFLLMRRASYELLGDPFEIAARHPPAWAARGELPAREWPGEPLPRRTVAGVMATLRAGDMPWLLGAAQALLDGNRLALESDGPAEASLRGVWQLLPDRTRCELRPATFANGLDLGFHVAALARVPTPAPPGYLTAEQTRDYPEGRYELALQVAAESGDQGELDRLLARRSSADTLKLAARIVAFAVAAALFVKLAI